ncbi:protein FAM13B isoform X2 [Scleropages formosus]|uniref:protein FAM13B isoform X2 n=1 Tax=Scleropages formosus TaxID=113540 RepID=UPI0010FAA43D|nr:protein FAM13B isoform X2 [Scleropages formosus]
MRKSLSPALSDSLSTARVFGIPLEEVRQSGQPGQEVPLLVKHIVEYIEEHGRLDLEGLFLVNGNAERVEWLRQRYDSGEEVDLEKEADLASAVSLLRLFLQELPEPVVPISLQGHILQLYQDYSSEEELARNMKYFLQQLPQVNYSLLRFLCRFLSGVASLQEDSWSTGGLAAVFGPDVFHLDTDVEDLKEQESVRRILTELLENQEEYFDSEEDDVSTTNDYSSINEQITELLDDDKLESCEELPRDNEGGPEDGPPSDSPEVSPSSSAHISPISLLPESAEIIKRTICAAVEQHFLDLTSSIGQEVSKEDPAEELVTEIADDDDQQSHVFSPQPVLQEDQGSEDEEENQQEVQSSLCHTALLESSGMDLDTEALVDAENNINSARQENHQPCEKMDRDNIITCIPSEGECDLNANSEPGQCPTQHASMAHLELPHVFPDGEREGPCPYTLPHIDFSCMHLQKEGQDPVPAFMSWQEEGEVGEAQLSPLAGRMVPLPLEEDAPPLLARRFLDFGHSQRFLQQDPEGASPSKVLPCGRPRRASFSSKESVKGDTVSQQLTKKLQNLKKKIKQFEEQFEKERNYKPSHGDKAANPKVLKWMTDLTKIRKQIKGRPPLFHKGSLRHQAVLQSHRRHSSSSSSSSAPNAPHLTLVHPPTSSKQAPLLYAKQKAEGELTPHTRPRSNTLPKSFGSTLEHAEHEVGSEGFEARGHWPTREETLEMIQQHLRDRRKEDGWPEDVRKMTKEQLSCEKGVLQKNLLHYESLHGRPVTREERLIVKPLYDRYRLVKQMLTRASITPIIASPSSKRRSQMLQPIIEGETAHFCDEIKEELEEEEPSMTLEEGGVLSEGFEVIIALDAAAVPSSQQLRPGVLLHPPVEQTSGKLALDLRLSSTNASSMPELLEQLWKARAEKKKLRKTIREFEDEFYQQNGRNVQKEDRIPMMDEYKEYKRVKAKLRLLEVLISKQDSSKSI